jgi:phage shock protein PspC (stress-responsive transcriptional regulator)
MTDLERRIENIDYMKTLREVIELNAFGVCATIGEKMGIATTRIRMWFIYISFLTFGSPLIIYMILAFWINIKNYIYSAKRNPLRYL